MRITMSRASGNIIKTAWLFGHGFAIMDDVSVEALGLLRLDRALVAVPPPRVAGGA
jgi:hypothetical protein